MHTICNVYGVHASHSFFYKLCMIEENRVTAVFISINKCKNVLANVSAYQKKTHSGPYYLNSFDLITHTECKLKLTNIYKHKKWNECKHAPLEI